MATQCPRQDMPPPGGYSPICFTRIPAKSYFPNGLSLFAAYLGFTAVGIFGYWISLKKNHVENVEMRSARMAILPMLVAEQDRAHLKQLRKNRDEEADLMKNVEGWKVGTLYGEPIYKTLPPDTYVDQTKMEYYGHAAHKDYASRHHLRFWM